MVDIDVKKFKDVKLQGGSLLEANPTIGLASTIACSYIISSLGLDQVSAWDSEGFPAVSMIFDGKPKFPARIYAAPQLKLAAFISEVPLAPSTHRSVARALMNWAREQDCKEIISLQGLPVSDSKRKELRLWGVGSSDHARERLEESGLKQLEGGMISGITATLLNEGRWQGFDVIALLVESRSFIPDAQAAAKLVEGVDALLPQVEIPTEPLYEQAELIERQLAIIQEQAKPAIEPQAPSGMYR